MSALAVLGAAAAGCSPSGGGGGAPGSTAVATTDPEQAFPTSLHATRVGKKTFYAAENGGFELLTGVPYEALACGKCHGPTLADGSPIDNATYVASCADCHADPDNPAATQVADATCLGCHSRQKAEIGLFTADVHRLAGMVCMDCHTEREMHGDGIAYDTLLVGAMDADCESCHATASLKPNAYHRLHLDGVDCSACHVQSVVACASCHFESELAGNKRYFSPPRSGFKLLVNWNGKVHSATFQSITHEDKTFLAIAPYTAHAITRGEEMTCGDCHRKGGGEHTGGGAHDDGGEEGGSVGNVAVDEYARTGRITLATWDPTQTGAARLVGPTGVIPIPPDWREALRFDFLTYLGDPATPLPATDPTLWVPLKSEIDLTHMPFGEPLTTEQMNALIFLGPAPHQGRGHGGRGHGGGGEGQGDQGGH